MTCRSCLDEPDIQWLIDWMVGVRKEDPLLWAVLTVISVIVVVGFFARAIWLGVVTEDKENGNIT